MTRCTPELADVVRAYGTREAARQWAVPVRDVRRCVCTWRTVAGMPYRGERAANERRPPYRVSPDTKRRICTLFDSGETVRRIAETVGVHRLTVMRTVQRDLAEMESHVARHGEGA